MGGNKNNSSTKRKTIMTRSTGGCKNTTENEGNTEKLLLERTKAKRSLSAKDGCDEQPSSKQRKTDSDQSDPIPCSSKGDLSYVPNTEQEISAREVFSTPKKGKIKAAKGGKHSSNNGAIVGSAKSLIDSIKKGKITRNVVEKSPVVDDFAKFDEYN